MGLQVAVVDDDPMVVDLVRLVLEGRGHLVATFTDPTKAMEHALANPVDVLVCDISMPGMEGDQLCQALTSHLGPLTPPVVVLSGGTDLEHVGRALDAGAVYFIKKPFAVGELVAMVERAFRRSSPSHLAVTPPAADPAWIGPYRVVQRLGQGGMGVVYRAQKPGHPLDVAVKVLPVSASSLDAQLRFRREFDILASLDHPAVARVLETGTDGQLVFYVMEYVPGRSLWAEIQAVGRIGWQRVVTIGRSAAVGLAYVHARGVIHRDIKPTNIMLLDRDTTKLVDFGVARRPVDLALTMDQVAPGTPLYLAPEAARGQCATPVCDVFALGLSLHFALAGVHPFAHVAQDLVALLNAYANGQIPPVREAVPDVPECLDALLAQCTNPNPDVRPSAREVARRLDALVSRPDGPTE